MAGTFKRPVSSLLHLFVLLGDKFAAFVRIGKKYGD
jgi:hypothetical protein